MPINLSEVYGGASGGVIEIPPVSNGLNSTITDLMLLARVSGVQAGSSLTDVFTFTGPILLTAIEASVSKSSGSNARIQVRLDGVIKFDRTVDADSPTGKAFNIILPVPMLINSSVNVRMSASDPGTSSSFVSLFGLLQ